MQKLLGQTGQDQQKGVFARYFPRAHAYFDKKIRFHLLYDAIEKSQEIGRRGLSIMDALMRFERTIHPSRSHIALLISDAVSRCNHEPNVLEFIDDQITKLEQKPTTTNLFIAAILLSQSSFTKINLEISDRFTRASELFVRAGCYNEAVLTGIHAIQYIRNQDDSVPIDRTERLTRVVLSISTAIRLKAEEYTKLELPINLATEQAVLFERLGRLDPRFSDLRDAAMAELRHNLSQLG
ncbi:MAG: hypothetical protein ABID61_04115 [Candidatus Micrarchaeota archaeon]